MVWVYAAICYVVITALLVFFHFRLLCLFFFVCLLHTRRIGFSFKRQIHKTNERFVNNKNALLFDESGIQRVCVCVVCFACETKVKKRAFYAVNWNIHADINKNGKSNSTSQQTKCCTIVACGTWWMFEHRTRRNVWFGYERCMRYCRFVL